MLVKPIIFYTHLIGIAFYLIVPSAIAQAETNKLKWIEPYPGKKAELGQLFKSKKKWFTTGRYVNKGPLGVKLDSVSYERVVLKMLADRRLNLWRGRANYMGTAHGGELTIDIDSVKDKKGKEIYRPDKEKPWDRKVTIYQRAGGVFDGSREFYIDQKLGLQQIGAVKGVINLNVPIKLKLFKLNVNSSASVQAAQQHPLIERISFKDNILSMFHPKPAPKATIIVLGYNKKGDLLQIFGTGASVSVNSRWYQFINTARVDKIHLWLSTTKSQHKIPFVITN